ncbi:MAG: AAA family ATPase [Mycoplasma sp.]|nr:AAA family ATPase [Mycoplasma sp.]
MKLIKVEAHGFKSFADKITLEFDGGVVGIVGPNGSGKSNINDAIKWVLGEQSSKSLRGDSMEDIIFAGSKKVPAMKFAEVSLTFDNYDKKISLPHKKIIITRRIVRGQGNQYYINSEIARLKDIKEIAMETGISKSSLAIISQGTISNIAQATPEERRLFFEEAAGISKYKFRKINSLRKLEKITNTLEKINSITKELNRQLKPLKKQSEKAKQYLELKKDLKDIEVSLIVEDVDFFRSKLEVLSERYKSSLDMKEELNSRIKESEIKLIEKGKIKLNLENQIIDLNEEIQKLSEEINKVFLRNSNAEQRRKLLIEGQIASTNETKKQAMQEQLEELDNNIFEYKKFIENSETKIKERKKTNSSIDIELEKWNSEKIYIKNKIYKIETKIDMLKDNQQNKSNLFKGSRTIIQNKTAFSGFKGIVSDLINVDIKYNLAIETVLQNALQHIVVSNSQTAVKCINFLKQNKSGRATFIPLNIIKPKNIREEHLLALKTQPGFIGIASDLISTEPEYKILNEFLLGNTIVTENIESAKKISDILGKRYLVVTIDGNVVKIGGIMSGGEKSKSKDLLGIDQQINKLTELNSLLEKKLFEINKKINNSLDSSSDDKTFIGELYIEIAKTKEKLLNTEEQYHFLKDKYESLTQEKFSNSNKSKNTYKSKETLQLQESVLKSQLKVKREKILKVNNSFENLSSIKTELESSLRQLTEEHSEIKTEKNQAEFYVNSSIRRLSEEYEMTIEIARNSFSLQLDREEARKIVSNKRKKITELGGVNLDAIEDFEKVEARFNKLSTSKKEIFNAQQAILQAINKMDKIITTKLDDTVSNTRKEFQRVFETMFGGGTAKIKYTNPANLLETGIEVIAQPPGKTVRNIKLFSGGEKAIIAISLLFAILKSKPLPLCILDEVEAALDEANVLRYANFLQTLKNKTQFIVVTHRIGTMETVDHLFGATMQKRGVTSFVTVKLDVAKSLLK